jgi:hypothetical protein
VVTVSANLTDVQTLGTPVLGSVLISTIAAGDNNIGNVDLVTLPSANLYPVKIHTIAIAIVNAAAAQTDFIIIDGVVCTFTSDATPTTTEISTGLRAAIASSAAAGKFTVTGTTNVILTPAYAYAPDVEVSANLTDVQTAGVVSLLGVRLSSSDAHIGEVGGNTTLVSCTPVVTAGAYHANDVVGGIQTLANAVRLTGGTGVVQSLVISDLAAQNAILEIYLFSATPGTGVYTDNAAMDLDDTDALLCIGRIDVAAADYKSLADNSIAIVKNIGLPIKVTGTSLFAVIRTPSTPTYAAVSDLKLTFGILRD